MSKVLSLDAFKEMVNTDDDFKKSITNRKDVIDKDNGVMRIYRENINKYLEEYYCKDSDELEDKLYHCYGIFCSVID